MNEEDLKEIINNINYAKEQKGCYENTYSYFKVSAIEKLVKKNQQLKDKINIYEDPDDLTLMFMYCDEQAKDKIKQLKDRIAYLERSISRKEETIIELQHELVETPKEVELENRIDKAIDKLICWGEVLDARFQQDMLDILEGGKNE